MNETPNWVDKNGHINENKLFRLLYGNEAIVRTKSYSTPFAQTEALYSVNSDPGELIMELLKKKETICNENLVLWYLIDVLIMGGLRITEALDIRVYDITILGHVRIKGVKGSNDRIIVTNDSNEYLRKCKEARKDPFNEWNRFFVYRQLKRFGIGHRFKGKINASVTHLFRQLSSRLMQNENFNDLTRSRYLGHKSKKTIQYYSEDEGNKSKDK